MNIVTDVRDVDGVMRSMAFTHAEAAKARAYLARKIDAVGGAERAEMSRAIHSLDLVLSPEDAYGDNFTMPGSSPAWAAAHDDPAKNVVSEIRRNACADSHANKNPAGRQGSEDNNASATS